MRAPSQRGRRTRAMAMAVVAVAVASLAGGAIPAPAMEPVAAPDGEGLPAGVADAARRPEPLLPAPPATAWPFDEGAPRTSGTGRHAGGAYWWTDYLYDDNGAVAGDSLVGESAGAPAFGGYVYPDPRAAGNGADIFRSGVGADNEATWWRVDWNTLVDPDVPIAAFAVDLDRSGGAPVAFPAGAGVSAAGIDVAVVLAAGGGRVIDLTSGTATPVEVVVDEAARTFIARVPRTVFDPSGISTVHLAAGLADDAGTGFRALNLEHRALPGQPNVYNVGYRDYDDEPAANNFWFERAQAQALALPGGDISAFAAPVEWDRLLTREVEPEPAVQGWTNRWYVSSVELGQGRTTDPASVADSEPNYLGRVQPYGVYVPRVRDGSAPLPLSWLLHSFTINHNQYSATTPNLLAGVCEARGALCATTLGRGPDGQYREEAELDFWEVWRALDDSYRLDPDRVTLGGYSMGGFGTFRFAADHPDAFAAIVILASAAGPDLARIDNLRWVPGYHAHGVLDQLVPYLGEAVPTADAFDALGQRYRFDTYPTKDHIAWALEDAFDEAANFLAEEDRVRAPVPGAFTYRFFPDDVDPVLGLGGSGTWWIDDLVACDPAPELTSVVAASDGITLAPVEVLRTEEPRVDPDGNPFVRRDLAWRAGTPPAVGNGLQLDFDGVASAAVDTSEASFAPSDGAEIAVTTTCPVTLSLIGVAPGTAFTLDGEVGADVGERHLAVAVPAGAHKIRFGGLPAAPPASPPSSPASSPASAAPAGVEPGTDTPASLPRTGGGAPGGALLVAGLALCALVRTVSTSSGSGPRSAAPG